MAELPSFPFVAELPLDISTDPALVTAQANAQRIRQLANAAALRQQIEVASKLGDEGTLRSIEGITEQQIQAALANPFTTLKDIASQGKKQRRGINEGRNQQGLFFSSQRARDLQEQNTGQQRNVAGAISGAQSALTGIQGTLASQLGRADEVQGQGVLDATRYQQGLYQQHPGIAGGGDAPAAGGATDPATFTFGGGKLAGQTFEQGDLSGVKQALKEAGVQKPTKYLSQGKRRNAFFLS